MNYAIYIAAFLPLLVVLIQQRRRETIIQRITKIKKESVAMIEVAQKFIGKECLIYTVLGNQVVGTIKEVSGNAILVDNRGTQEAVNLDFIVRIREYPRNKNGKKKSVILD